MVRRSLSPGKVRHRGARLRSAVLLLAMLCVSGLAGCAGGGWDEAAKARWRNYWELEQIALSHRREGEFEQAAVIYATIWREAAAAERLDGTPSVDSLADDMRRLAERWPGVRECWRDLWEPTRSRVIEGAATGNELDAWLRLVEIMGSYDSLVIYLELAKTEPRRLEQLRDRDHRESSAYWLAKKAGRWDLAGIVYEDPLGDIRSGELADLLMLNPPAILLIGSLGNAIAPRPSEKSVVAAAFDFGAYGEALRKSDQWRAEAAANRYAACLAAGREREAERLLRFAKGKVGGTVARAICLEQAIHAGVVRLEHAGWFVEDAALAEMAPDLRRQVLEILAREP